MSSHPEGGVCAPAILLTNGLTTFEAMTGAKILSGEVEGYELDHTTDEGYCVGFCHDSGVLPLSIVNGRLVPDDIAIWRTDGGPCSVKSVTSRWHTWTASCTLKLAPRRRHSGDSGIRMSNEGVVRKRRRDMKNDDEEEKEVEESEERDVDDVDDVDVDVDVDMDMDVDIRWHVAVWRACRGDAVLRDGMCTSRVVTRGFAW